MKEKIFKFIKEFITANKYAPTVREICQGVGLKSNSTAFRYLHMLRDDGVIGFRDGIPRTISILKDI